MDHAAVITRSVTAAQVAHAAPAARLLGNTRPRPRPDDEAAERRAYRQHRFDTLGLPRVGGTR